MGTGKYEDPGKFYAENGLDPFSLFRELGGHGRADSAAGTKPEPVS